MHSIENTRKIILGGITASLVVASLYCGNLIVNNRFFFLALATYISSIQYIAFGRLYGFTAYAASAALAFILIPNKLYALAYIILGIYPLVKLLCERYYIIKEFALKYLWFNITLGAVYFIFRNLSSVKTETLSNTGIVILMLGSQVVFFVYDYIFTRFIVFVDNKVLKKL